MSKTTFFSIGEVNVAIKELPVRYNNYVFKLTNCSRRELCAPTEQIYLKPLPATSFELRQYRRAKVQKMGYIFLAEDKHYYSVPYRFIGNYVEVRYTHSVVEIFYNHERLCTHERDKLPGNIQLFPTIHPVHIKLTLNGVVQEFLIKEIKKNSSEFISKKDAIFFLRQNTKPQHAQLFRELFTQSKHPQVRRAAIEGLDNDHESIDLLKKTVLNEKENFKVRHAGSLSLHHIEHDAMNELATRIIAKPNDDGNKLFFTSSAPDPDEVNFKAALLNMVTFTGDISRLKQNENLKTSLRRVVDPGNTNKSNFRSSFDTMHEASLKGLTIIEQMAAQLLNKFDASDEGE